MYPTDKVNIQRDENTVNTYTVIFQRFIFKKRAAFTVRQEEWLAEYFGAIDNPKTVDVREFIKQADNKQCFVFPDGTHFREKQIIDKIRAMRKLKKN